MPVLTNNECQEIAFLRESLCRSRWPHARRILLFWIGAFSYVHRLVEYKPEIQDVIQNFLKASDSSVQIPQ